MRRRVIVAASPDWPRPEDVWIALDEQLFERGLTPADTLVVVHNGSPVGPDLEVDRWTKARSAEIRMMDIRVERHPVDYESNGRIAQEKSNVDMISQGANECIAFVECDFMLSESCAWLAETIGIPTRRWPID